MKVVLPLIHLDNLVFTPLPQLLLKQQLILDGVCAAEEVEILEYSREDDIAATFSAIVACNPDVVAFSSYVWNHKVVEQLSKALKDYYGKKVTVAWGGPHVSEKPDWFAKTYKHCCDYVFGWYGELNFSKVMAAFKEGNLEQPLPAYSAEAVAVGAKAPEFDEMPLPYQKEWLPKTTLDRVGERVALLETYRNCCVFDTKVATPSGDKDLGELLPGDYVFGYDGTEVVLNEVKTVYDFGFKPVYEVVIDGVSVIATEDHPFYTNQGVKLLNQLQVGDKVCYLQEADKQKAEVLFQKMSSRRVSYSAGKKTLSGLRQNHVGEAQRNKNMLMGLQHQSSEGMAGPEMGCNQSSDMFRLRGENGGPQTTPTPHTNCIWQQHHLFGQVQKEDAEQGYFRQQKSNEEGGSSKKGISVQQNDQSCVVFKDNEAELGCRQDYLADVQSKHGGSPKQIRATSSQVFGGAESSISVCGELEVLGRTMSFWSMQKPGFYCNRWDQESNSSSRYILAQRPEGSLKGIEGLQGQGLGLLSDLGGLEAQPEIGGSDSRVRIGYGMVQKITPVGSQPVHDIEAYPTHNFFANGCLVHNCPFSCAYCLWGKAANKIEGRPLDLVLKDFDHLLGLGFKHYKFADAGLGLIRPRDKELFRKFADMRLDKMGVHLRTYFFWMVVDDEWAEIFKELIGQGVIGQMDVGIQTFNAKALTDMHRPTDYKRFDRVMEILQRHKIPYSIDLILGLPGDNLEGFKHSVKECIRYKPKRFQSFLCSVLPGAGYDLRREELGIKTIRGSLMDDDEKVIETKTFPRADVQTALDIEAWLYMCFSMQLCDVAINKVFEDTGVNQLTVVENLKTWATKNCTHLPQMVWQYRKNLYDSRQKGRVECDKYLFAHFKDIYQELMSYATIQGVEEEMRDCLLRFPKTVEVAKTLVGVDELTYMMGGLCRGANWTYYYKWRADPIPGVIGTKYAFWTWEKISGLGVDGSSIDGRMGKPVLAKE